MLAAQMRATRSYGRQQDAAHAQQNKSSYAGQACETHKLQVCAKDLACANIKAQYTAREA